MQGRDFGHYRLHEKLGAGGMGEVWLAMDLKLEREVALKFLHQGLGLDAEAEERLLREARAASALEHPGILTIHAIERADGRSFIVMERLIGEGIDEAAEGLDADQSAALVQQAADAVAAAHLQDIVHRDLKPSNLFVDERGRVVVMDFGLAQVKDAPQLTRSGTTLGTLGYTAPEQLRGEAVDARADVFALGAVLYQLLSGRPPFDAGQGVAAVIRSVLEDEPAPLEGVPQALVGVCAKALAKDPAERYADAGELRDAIRAARLGRSNSESAANRPRMIALGVAALMITTILIMALLRDGDTSAHESWTAGWAQRKLPLFDERPREPTLSPDGRSIAFTALVDGTPQLFTADLADPSPRALTNTERGASEPRWSPAGDSILFHEPATDPNVGYGRVLTVAPLGGEPRVLLASARDASWGAGGARVVFEREVGVWLLDVENGEEQRIDEIPRVVSPMFSHHAVLSPDGRYVAYLQSELGPLGRVDLLDLESLQTTTLVAERAQHRDLVFTNDGERVVFASNMSGSLNLWSVRRDGSELAPITTGAGDDLAPALGANDRSIAFTNRRDEYDIVVFDPADGSERVVHTSRSQVFWPRFSPDGSNVAFTGDSGTSSDLYVVTTEGGEPRRLTRGGEMHLFPRWDAGDGSIYHYVESIDGPSLQRLSPAGGEATVVADGWSLRTHPFAEPSPIDDRVAVFAIEPPGAVIFDPATGIERPLGNYTFRPRWSPDGRWLVGEDFSGQIALIELGDPSEPESTDRLVRLEARGQAPLFSHDGERVYFLRSMAKQEFSVFALDLDDSTGEVVGETLIHELGAIAGEGALDVDVDPAGRVLWCRFRPVSSEIWLFEARD